MKNKSSFHILFFDGAQRVGNTMDAQVKRVFPELDVRVITLTDKEIELTHHQDNILVVGYSLGVRRALEWVSKNAFKGPVYLLDPECWKPSNIYKWVTQNILGQLVFSLVVKHPFWLNMFTWVLPKRMKRYIQLFVRNKEFRNQLYQDWIIAAHYKITPLKGLGALKSQITIVISGEVLFMRYIPFKDIEQQGVKVLSLTESPHSQLWKHFFKVMINPNENAL